MIIENLEREYLVIRREFSENGADKFICKRSDDNSLEQYSITRIFLEKLAEDGYIASLVELLTRQKSNQEFYDFVEYFTDARFIYIVMIFPTDISLAEKLETEDCSLSERVEIGKYLLERIILLKAPSFFYWSALTLDGIRISRALEISFQYDLTDICHYKDYGIWDVEKKLAEQLQLLFQKELKLVAFPKMQQFILLLRDGKFKNYISIYEQYLRIYETGRESKKEDFKPNKLTFRLWERIKQLGGLTKKLVAVLILILAAAYTFLSIKEFIKPPEQLNNYQQIGSLDIKK